MKKILYIACLAAIGFTACTSDEVTPTRQGSTKALSQVYTNHITLDNVRTLSKATSKKGLNETRADVEDKNEYICITGEDDDTLFFVVNFPEGGWRMIHNFRSINES